MTKKENRIRIIIFYFHCELIYGYLKVQTFELLIIQTFLFLNFQKNINVKLKDGFNSNCHWIFFNIYWSNWKLYTCYTRSNNLLAGIVDFTSSFFHGIKFYILAITFQSLLGFYFIILSHL